MTEYNRSNQIFYVRQPDRVKEIELHNKQNITKIDNI